MLPGPLLLGRSRRASLGQQQQAGGCPRALCTLRRAVQGVVKERSFRKFKSDTFQTEAAARTFLSDHKVGHYWELCAAYRPE